MKGNIFSMTGAYKPKRNVFDLSYRKSFDCDEGYIYPVLCDECVPGDTVKLGYDVLARVYNPPVAPMIQACNMDVRYFFVPTRLLFTENDIPNDSSLGVSELWETFLGQGKDGLDDSVSLPRWRPANASGYGVHSLWDYFGFPTGIQPASDYCPLSFCKRAYNLVYNNFYRNENLIDEVDLDSDVLQRASWNRDYFTTALPWQQRGQAPALPINISGVAPVLVHANGLAVKTAAGTSEGIPSIPFLIDGHVASNLSMTPKAVLQTNVPQTMDTQLVVAGKDFTSTSFNIADLRLAFQIQRFMEANATGGVRYTEFLRRHFGVSPRDERLQIPEFIGGGKSPLVISEVLQTSGTEGEGGTQETPQGNLAGHGMIVGRQYISTYHVQEFGYIIGLMFIRPKASYCQGINRQWLRRTRYDFYFPEFAHLSEQAVETAELYTVSGESTNGTIFGYQGRYNEMRHKPDIICGDLRSTLSYWHQGRIFDSAPLLNKSFVECNPSKRVFAVQDDTTAFVVDFGNVLKIARPMPAVPTPGLIDHN